MQSIYIVINLSDFLIIYLACGAPFGVNYFLHNRKKIGQKNLRLKSFLTVFVWIPYAFVLLHDFATKKRQSNRQQQNFQFEARLREIQQKLSRFFLASPAKISLFEFREILERYVGLTLALNSANTSPDKYENEIFRIALRENNRLGAKCLHRRNRQRLELHQMLARKDFLAIVTNIKLDAAQAKEFRALTTEFLEMLSDLEAQRYFADDFKESLQTANDFNVHNLETDVWKSKERKPLAAVANRLTTRS